MATVDLAPIVKPETAKGANLTVRERFEKRFESAKKVREPYEQDWEEIERLCLPARSSYLGTVYKRRSNTAKQDTAGRIAGRTLVNGMSTGLSSSYRPWFKLGTPDPELKEFQPVKDWLFEVERLIYNLFATTNYYETAKISYAHLGHMGFSCTLGLEHSEYRAVWHSFDQGEAWIAQDDGLRATTLFLRPSYTVDQMVRKFPWEKLSSVVRTAYDKGDVSKLVPVMCVIEKNGDRDESKLDKSGKEYRSIWWEIGQSDKNIILKEGGFDTKPFTSPRWDTSGAEVYSSSSPGFDALPDLRELELTARRYGRSIDLLVKPPVFVPAGMQQTPLSLDPGSMNFVNEMQGKVELLKPDPNIPVAIERRADFLTKRVNQLFYADLWMAITDMEGIQPKNEQELLYRNEEKLTQLGPVVDRVNIEKLEVDIDRAYTILDNLGQIPPAPKELQGKALMVEFVSILAQAQLAAANTGIERAARFIGFIGGQFPDALIKFDAEQAVDEFAYNSGTTPKIIRSDEVVAQMKAKMAQQQAMKQAQEMAPAMAQGAQAAELLSRTQVGPDTSMLDQLMGQ